MPHSVFQTAQIMPINTQIIPTSKTLSSKPFLPIHNPVYLSPVPSLVAGKLRKCLVVKASSSSSSVVDGDTIAGLERCFRASPPSDSPSLSSASSSPSSSVMYGPVMKGEYGAFGAVTLEKSKLDLTQKQSNFSPETAIGGGGGDIGKKINNGGGDGGDDGGDDDDYFDDFDDGDEGDEGGLFRRRIVLQELFDRKFVDAVLNEWQRTVMDLPAGLRQAYEMGLVSSAQMVKFLAINARPTTTRFISRSLPQGISRAFIGRMIADPAFLYRLLLEQAATIGCSVWWELKNRKERIKQEWDLALINVLTVTACNAIVVWSLAPCRSYGNTFRFDLQNTLQKLPNNIFEKSYPLREFDLQKRIHSFFYKAAELCMVGFTAGAAQGALSKLSASKKEGRLSVTVPTVSSNALGYGAFLGLYANLRYQLLCGIDRAMINHFDVIGVALFFGTALRILNVQLGETSRLAWLGVEVDPLAQSDDLLKAYNRPSETGAQPSSKWFISKNAIVSGLGLLGIKQGNSDSVAEGESSPPKARRKRIVRKKVTTSRA
ncbi:hypothetical protein F0562_029007 [Nyssa sinensis]|uniref:Protein RETICULATA-RELATED 1, chloroplastic n=1 Tax=Nyssa sinensis TaxID=561372 RepID=A0A5J5B1F8_9ASTE|nr:hypothetical protein F0562_029007 [Nyssa sinensis]